MSGEENPAGGLTSEDARARLAKFGPNAMPDTAVRPWRIALAKFWAPVPWMLEAAVILQIVLHEYVEAAVIALLLVFNAALGFFQEGHAQATLAALKSRLALMAAVRRDGAWKNIPATEVLAIGKFHLGFGIAALRTLAFVVLVFSNQATTYMNRTRRHLWSIRPSLWLILSSVADLSIASTLASRGIAMAPLPLFVMGGTLLGAAVFAFLVDMVKVPIFHRLRVA